MSQEAIKTPSISVIMPAYNVEAFVLRAAESVLRQSFYDFEFLVVDDGSNDRTGQILDSLAEKDMRMDVFHLENGGAPAARNYALDRARGRYVAFMDADDFAEPSMLENMFELAETNRAELVVAGFYIDSYYTSEDYSSELKSVASNNFVTQHDFRVSAYKLFDENLLYTPWNKLFLRERIEKLGLRFKETFWDDFPFVLDYIRDVERVCVSEKAWYHFIRAREDSETSRWRADLYEKREEEHSWMLELYRHWGLDGDPNSIEMIQRRYIERLVGCIESVCSPSCELSKSEKRSLVGRMISSERARLACSLAKPRSKMMELMLAPIKANNLELTMAEGNFISFVKRHNTRLFTQLKARR